jgi:hypothetical protein
VVVERSKSSLFEKKIMTNNLATSIELKTTGIDKASIPKQAIKNIVPSQLQQAPKWRADEILDIKLCASIL